MARIEELEVMECNECESKFIVLGCINVQFCPSCGFHYGIVAEKIKLI